MALDTSDFDMLQARLNKIIELLQGLVDHSKHPLQVLNLEVPKSSAPATNATWSRPCKWCGRLDCYEAHILCQAPLKNGDSVTMTGSVGAIS